MITIGLIHTSVMQTNKCYACQMLIDQVALQCILRLRHWVTQYTLLPQALRSYLHGCSYRPYLCTQILHRAPPSSPPSVNPLVRYHGYCLGTYQGINTILLCIPHVRGWSCMFKVCTIWYATVCVRDFIGVSRGYCSYVLLRPSILHRDCQDLVTCDWISAS